MFENYIWEVTDVDANSVTDFAMGYRTIAYLIAGDNKSKMSIVPEKPEAKGLIHFFKKDGNWAFVTEDEYEEKKSELPKLSFASRHPISDFNSKTFADLAALESQLTFAADGEPQYYAKYTLGVSDDEESTTVTASEKMAQEGGQTYDMNPVIFVRSSTPASNAFDVIQSIKLADFFEQTENENVQYTI